LPHYVIIITTLLIYNLKLELFINVTLVYFAELLTDFSYTNFTVSYRDALDRLCSFEHYLVSKATATAVNIV